MSPRGVQPATDAGHHWVGLVPHRPDVLTSSTRRRAGAIASAHSCRQLAPCLLFEGDPLRAPRQPGCRPLALYTAAALGSARKSISAFAAIGCYTVRPSVLPLGEQWELS